MKFFKTSNARIKFLSAFLAFSFLITFAPTGLIWASAEDPQQIVVDFSQTTTALSGDKYVITSSPGYTVDETKSQTGTRRKFVYDDTSALHVVVEEENGTFWPTDTTMNTRFTIKVQVPVASNYNVKLQGGLLYVGCIASVYVDNAYMGDYSFYNGDTTNSLPRTLGEIKQLNSVYLTAGEHSISFRSRNAFFSIPYLLLHKLFLDPVAASTLQSVTASAPGSLTVGGETGTLTAQAMMSDNAPYQFGLKEDGTVDTANTVTVTSSNTNAVAVSNVQTVVAGGGDTTTATLTAMGGGQSTITVTATVGGVTKTTTKTVVSHAAPIVVDFSQTTTALSGNNYVITSSPGYTVDETKSQTGTRRKFIYDDTSALHVVVEADNGTFWPTDTTMNTRFTIKVQVPVASNYNIKLQGGLLYVGCIASVYVDNAYMGDYSFYNGDTTNSLPRTLGEIKRLNSVYLTAGEHSISFRSRNAFFSIPYLLLHKLFLDPVTAAPTLQSVTASAPESLTVGGETGTLTAQAMMSDNAPYQFGLKEDGTVDTANTVTVTSSNTNAVAVSNVQTVVAGGGDTTTATLTAMEEGQSTITVTATVGGVTKTTTKTVVSHATQSVVDFSQTTTALVNGVYVITSSPGYTVDETKSQTGTRRKFIYDDTSALHVVVKADNGTFWPTDTTMNTRFTIKVQVPVASNYNIKLQGGLLYVGCITSVYIDNAYMGDYSFYNGDTTNSLPRTLGEIKRLNSVYLSAGEHSISFRSRNAFFSIPYLLLYKLFLDPVAAAPTLQSISSDIPEILSMGGTAHVNIKAMMSDNYPYNFGLTNTGGNDTQNYMTATNSNQNAVTLSSLQVVKIGDGANATATITPVSVGTSTITVTAKVGSVTKTRSTAIQVQSEGLSSFTVTAGGSEHIKLAGGSIPLHINAVSNLGNEMDLSSASITYQSVTPTLATVNSSGYVTPLAEGDAKFLVTVTLYGITKSSEVTFPIIEGKTAPTIYTAQKRTNIRTNKNTYSWAASEVSSCVTAAGMYVNRAEQLWNMIVSEGLPRSMTVGDEGDHDANKCRYCGANLLALYGPYSQWTVDPLNTAIGAWKIKCPSCSRCFPSNDFASFYQLGLDEKGVFNSDLAHRKNAAIIANGGTGYLVNVLYPEKGTGWGVDDGFGYLPGHTYENGVIERHTYIAYYLHWGIWRKNNRGKGVIRDAVNTLARAYAYTGDAKYGRTGAILLDRIADFYPDYELHQWHNITWNAHGGLGRGKILGCIWECDVTSDFALAYDMLYPVYDDQYVIDFLSNKASTYHIANSKQTATQLRNNVEDGILRTIYSGVQDSSISGNFGLPQLSIATAAVALNSMPETGEWLDWMMKEGARDSDPCTGGNVAAQLVDVVDRDGMGNEASSYNTLWLDYLINVADVLKGYETYAPADLYQNAKFAKMFSSFLPLTLCSYFSPQIGDSNYTASKGLWMTTDMAIKGFRNLGDSEFAQTAYLLNNNSVTDLREDITVANPEQIQTDIQNVINQEGTLSLGSEMMTGFGFAVLRDGVKTSTTDTQRDFWIYFGKSTGHGHLDTLNLGVEAYGLNMAPDLGYPELTGTQPNRLQWVENTLSHNTVVVGEERQQAVDDHGFPLHFDDSGKVKVMDINTTGSYSAASIYRRTLVMVKASDDVAYGVDFFRVRGGNKHLYSFHSQSDEIYATTGLTLVSQVDGNGNFVGTYAGAGVPWGPDPTSPNIWDYVTTYPRGFTWLDQVKRDTAPNMSFSVDFKVKDFRNILPGDPNLHLRLTMVNDIAMTDATIANGYPPNKSTNACIPNLKYLLVRRLGTNLDTLFTAVYEPYKDSRYVSSILNAPTTIVSGTPGATDKVKAVKVTHTSGRIDYIVYATNNTVTYRINDVFNFRGSTGVYTVEGGNPTYTYVNDGDIIGSNTYSYPAVTGTVYSFTSALQKQNQITVTLNQTVTAEALTGKYIYINNDGVQNGVYKIESATLQSGKAVLNIGGVSPIRSYIDASNLNGGYVYNIAAGQTYRIPFAYSQGS